MVAKSIAIIPARGGSQRIPRKNLIEFGGQPLISWTIQAALESEIFHRVLVSTEDEEIAEVSRDFGAEVPFLRDSNFDDYSTASQATIRALQQVQSHYDEDYEVVTQLMPNCPLRDSKDIISAMEAFVLHEKQPQISCAPFGWVNPWWANTIDDDGTPSPLFPEAREKRSQDLAELFFPTGAIWISKTEDLIQGGSFYTSNYRFQPISFTHAIDIDVTSDLELARLILSGYGRN